MVPFLLKARRSPKVSEMRGIGLVAANTYRPHRGWTSSSHFRLRKYIFLRHQHINSGFRSSISPHIGSYSLKKNLARASCVFHFQKPKEWKACGVLFRYLKRINLKKAANEFHGIGEVFRKYYLSVAWHQAPGWQWRYASSCRCFVQSYDLYTSRLRISISINSACYYFLPSQARSWLFKYSEN